MYDLGKLLGRFSLGRSTSAGFIIQEHLDHCDQWCIKEIDESLFRVNSLVPLICHDPNDFGS